MSAPEVLPPVDGLAPAPVDKPAPPPMSGAPYKPPVPTVNPNASLYVGELDPTVTEAILFEIFNMIGPVARYVFCLRSPSLAR
jgi:polyadenylate-binding protein